MIRVLLFEDNKIYREAFEDAFEGSDTIYITKALPHAKNAVKEVRERQPDVILMDIEMPGISGLDALSKIREANENAKVLIQTQFEDNHRIFVALCRGALGYTIKKDLEKLEEAIIHVHNGGGYFSPVIAGKVARFFINSEVKGNPDYIELTKREEEVLKALAEAKTYQEIADEMYIGYNGVHSHIKNIYKKLHVNSRSKAVLKAIESKLI